jgi:hypothetical protein
MNDTFLVAAIPFPLVATSAPATWLPLALVRYSTVTTGPEARNADGRPPHDEVSRQARDDNPSSERIDPPPQRPQARDAIGRDS